MEEPHKEQAAGTAALGFPWNRGIPWENAALSCSSLPLQPESHRTPATIQALLIFGKSREAETKHAASISFIWILETY